ncbi:MAG: 50S ribosomal protein L5, partial [Nitrospinae bacterium]|nr:50S ribosomal protein L5 [Nitrospinota bacterium]
MANLKKAYNEKLKPQIQKDLGLANVMEVPRLEKIVVNMGLGEALQNGKLIDAGVDQLRTITGQHPVVTRSKKAISNFKLREGV